MTDCVQAPLHPERIRAALRALALWKERGDPAFDGPEIETCQAALELVRKGQLILGLNDNVVDSVQALLALGRLSERRVK